MREKPQQRQLKHQGVGILGLLLLKETTMKISAQPGNNSHIAQAPVAQS